jgi:hypothetical protein
MKELALYNRKELTKLTSEEMREAKDNEIANYLTKFLLDNKVESKDRVPMIIAFDELKPIDLTDAFLCANIVYCQHVIGELNEYRTRYQRFEATSKRSSARYRWAVKEYSSMADTLAKMIRNRNDYIGKNK